MSQKQRRTSVIFLCVVPVLTIFLWLGSRDSQCSDMGPIHEYGGKIPKEIVMVLASMVSDIQNAQTIIEADADHIVIINSKGFRKSYAFDYGSLWKDRMPIVNGVRGFHFEYRDEMGNYLTRITRHVDRLHAVGFTMRFQLNEKPILANSKFKLANHTFSQDINSVQTVSLNQ